MSTEILFQENQTISDTVGATSQSIRLNLPLNHAITAIYFVVKGSKLAVNDDFDFRGPQIAYGATDASGSGNTGEYVEPVDSFKLRLNNQDRYSEDITPGFLRLVDGAHAHDRHTENHIYPILFALSPGEPSPSGSLNFSRIDNASLQLECNASLFQNSGTASVFLYARNFNVLRVSSGLGGKAFSS